VDGHEPIESKTMKLGTIEVITTLGRHERVAVDTEAGLVDATAARVSFLERSYPALAARRVGEAQVPPNLKDVIAIGKLGLDWIREAVDCVVEGGIVATAQGQRTVYQVPEVSLLAPIPRPPGINCCTTWEHHIKEAEARGSSVRWPEAGSPLKGFYKANSRSVAGGGTIVPIPPFADDDLDIECELAAIVGTGGINLSNEEAVDAIAGYCIFNDVSFRNRQRSEMRLGLGPTTGKDSDGANILGPWLVTADEIGDVSNLTMSLHVNGEIWSSMNTREMAWPISDVLSYMSQGQTIYPGHIITSGSYPGGCGSDLGRKLRPGDTFELKITGLGSLANQFALR
jgi:2-keto-4-pentenoate hydratase/2-oxohepta-3-ene-1,7-dioic acid hydratase in catechol pathway